MQQYVTKQMLTDLGIEVKDTDADSLLTHLNERIEEMIGAEITESLDDKELEELVKLQKNGSDDELGDWIVTHVPNYQEIVQDNIDIAVGEMVDNADDINEVVQ
tara:strand:+ start:440 stop:751 length:312 start_codon:yes stop_codon:yes gene_type:complete